MYSYEALARALPTLTTTDAAFDSASIAAAGISDRIEMILFGNRFCAVIVGHVAARERLGELSRTVLGRELPTGTAIDEHGNIANLADSSHELQVAHEMDCGFVEEAIRLSGATALLAASAALELLVGDLGSGNPRRPLRQKILDLTSVEECHELADRVIRRRNMLAHELDGSYWSPPLTRLDLSDESVSASLADVGRLADLLEDAV